MDVASIDSRPSSIMPAWEKQLTCHSLEAVF